MQICRSENEYIKLIAPAVQRACKRYGYLPSVLIAQSCLENGFGIREYWDNPQIELLLEANNMVGIKTDLLNSSWSDYTVWGGKSISKLTPEEYGGKSVTIKDSFRVYDSIEQSFCDFLLFLTYASIYGKGEKPKYGQAVMAIRDPASLIREVSRRGYATGSTYSSSVMKIINKHDLTDYDNLSGVVATDILPGSLKEVTISISEAIPITDITVRNRGQVPRNRGSNPIEFIVIHYLGVPNADNPDLYGGGYGGHYNITRAGKIYKAADPKTAVVWHCGGGLQGSGGHSFYKICTNFNSIGIECGVCYAGVEKEPSGNSGKWFFTKETQESLVYLVSKLMDEYNIPVDHVIRHFDVTGKICPNPYVKNNKFHTSWTWNEFLNNLKQYRKNKTITVNDKKDTDTAMETKSFVSASIRTLRQGSNGLDVKIWQTICGATADGDFGPKTLESTKKYQRNHGLAVDGIVGSKTWTMALNNLT